ncbi:hypothetical protein O9K51_01044 [Purpureocillium lavendulum]|uniref:Uncharacterized protein n=1 Tax=Purpureocillium lavendulum TaxID=1247861 RepID=A0AB34G4T0_9HYPO|nr:hypothetical protein O9K51_01044 [Purpureocillium lavendulum]
MDHIQLSHTLADAFNALADEVQLLADRKTVLEHKLRFAHEQFQYLADKYAPATPEIAETLAKLQLPPHTSVDETSPVPLPHRSTPQSQHQLALVIRDGRRAASRLASLGESSKTTGSSRESLSHSTRDETSMSTALEQDFTVQGKKGNLQCPFSKKTADNDDAASGEMPAELPQHVADDPICMAMYEESMSQPPPSGTGASKCPIRFMDRHSPEEIAHYVETHKHELPRSHEVCLRRYQKSEDQMKKLDSKYGNIVSMIEGLSHLHQPMLPEEEQQQQQHRRSDVDRASNERVENWAHAVTATAEPHADEEIAQDEADRQGHFDRPLKEVRVGESPSRPWGISVPVYETFEPENEHPMSPPAAPVRMPSPLQGVQPQAKGTGKCPFDHTKLAALKELAAAAKPEEMAVPGPSTLHEPPPVTPARAGAPKTGPPMPQPAFINPAASKEAAGGAPQMVFTGPVFIGYPMDQAIQFMNQYRGHQ